MSFYFVRMRCSRTSNRIVILATFTQVIIYNSGYTFVLFDFPHKPKSGGVTDLFLLNYMHCSAEMFLETSELLPLFLGLPAICLCKNLHKFLHNNMLLSSYNPTF